VAKVVHKYQLKGEKTKKEDHRHDGRSKNGGLGDLDT
jgi:hypothetical protein